MMKYRYKLDPNFYPAFDMLVAHFNSCYKMAEKLGVSRGAIQAWSAQTNSPKPLHQQIVIKLASDLRNKT